MENENLKYGKKHNFKISSENKNNRQLNFFKKHFLFKSAPGGDLPAGKRNN
jgi:hypothetical protein